MLFLVMELVVVGTAKDSIDNFGRVCYTADLRAGNDHLIGLIIDYRTVVKGL